MSASFAGSLPPFVRIGADVCLHISLGDEATDRISGLRRQPKSRSQRRRPDCFQTHITRGTCP